MIRLTIPRILIGFSLLILCLLLLRPLLPVDETRYLAVAWEMHLSGDPLHLTRNFAPYSHKPPLLFWLINLVWGLTGVSEFAARLVGPAFALAVIGATAGLARNFWPGERGPSVAAAAVLAGFSLFQLYGSTTMFDAMLSLAVLGGIAALWRIGYGEQGRAPWAALGVMLAFGAYAKGPVILIHLLPPLLLMRFWAPEPPVFRDALKGFALALAIALALVALWLVPTLLTADADFRRELLWNQSANRIAGGMAHDRPAWFLLALLPVIVFPWGWSGRFWSGLPQALRTDPAAQLCLIWAVSGVVLFSFVSSKQAHYLLPELPALALLVARPMSLPGQGRSLAPWLTLAAAVIVAMMVAGIVPVRTEIVQQTFPLLGLAAGLAGLGLLARRLDLLPGHLILGAGVTLGLHLFLYVTGALDIYDSRRLAILLSPAGDGQLAVTGTTYNAEVNFTARYKLPVATPATADDLVAWAVAHPQGLVFGPVATAPIKSPPDAVLSFAGDMIGIWPASAALSARE